MQEAAQPWEPHFVPRETVPETVRCLLSRKPTRLKQEEVGQLQHSPLAIILKQEEVIQQQQSLRVLLRGARVQGALSGGIKAAATTQPAEIEGQEPVRG